MSDLDVTPPSPRAAGIDWIIAHHPAGTPAVANLSLSGPGDLILDSAVSWGIADGISFVVAAGNDARPACTYSPARVGDAITIAASDAGDGAAGFSNYGSCVDWFAPGVNIQSTWIASTAAYSSGTSMAAPQTSGVAALHLQGNPSTSPTKVRNVLFNRTTKDAVVDPDTANNHLLSTRFQAPPHGGPAPLAVNAVRPRRPAARSRSVLSWWWGQQRAARLA